MSRSLVRTASWIAAGVAAGAVIGRVRRQRTAIAHVAPELRSPILHLPMDIRSDRMVNLARTGIARSTPIAPGVAVRTERIAASPESGADGPSSGVRILVYEPEGRSTPSGAIVWLHGGGTILGIPEQSHDAVSRIAAELGVLVVSVDYRLAPEHPFPAALEDGYAALAWLADQADALGVDPARIAVGGDSAGGLLAASLAQLARARGGPALAFQALVYPMLDDRTDGSAAPDRPAFVWTPASNRFAWAAYVGRDRSAAASPAGDVPTVASVADGAIAVPAAPARCDDLTGLPPAWIGVGDLDLFLEEDLDYAARLEAAGVPCELHIEPGMYHGADAIFPSRASMVAFRRRLHDALRSAIG